MGCPSPSSCLLRQMSPVSAAITAQLNINDSLGWQVLAGQRRGERGTPPDKTRDEKEKWWLYLPDKFSFVSLNLCICMCAISRFLAWCDGFIALFFPPLWGDGPLCSPIAPHPSCWHFWHSLKYLCISASVCLSVQQLICRSACVSFIFSWVFLGEGASWTLMLAKVMVVTAGHREKSHPGGTRRGWRGGGGSWIDGKASAGVAA